ncbi:hypothetical protein ACX3VT_07450 [Aerococcus sanguinicola]|uniref:hypothetical protein n=1 Tax=unclassified Aerococcus TaxID=2618060 RepID=UPI0008A5E1C8|nr:MULTISPECIES: hypothetical protein [unclassified Aerococcus]KAB0646750.1 hypothetical protein F6I01_06025 [Aerococcus sanguinicola]MDK6233899.1 hypothetical protein [Aerococcus sp. UMB10185]MDK6805653.1 hypothetical protein [Aerococcus sp. UMB7834]MDK6856573.1 hypothetical protein [Aerococcus sp. UMB7533]MDK8502763.1 hypothetical protein [Aerococcus sp. UMB1112A]
MTEDRLRKVTNALICLPLLAYVVLVFSDVSRFVENLALYTSWTMIYFKKACEEHGFDKWPSNLVRALVQMGVILLLVNLIIQVFPEASQRRLALFLVLLAYIAYLLFKQIKN